MKIHWCELPGEAMFAMTEKAYSLLGEFEFFDYGGIISAYFKGALLAKWDGSVWIKKIK